MTKDQKDYAWYAFRRLQALPGGKYMEMFVSLTGIVRIQSRENHAAEKHTRMFCILEKDRQHDIENKIMDAFFQIREEIGHEKS